MKLTQKIGIFLMVLTMLFYVGYSLTKGTYSTESVNSIIKEQQQAIIETADAYYRQKYELQYDSYRKQFNATPEDATSQHVVYTVCSGFVYQVYYQALGIKLPTTTDELLSLAADNYQDEVFGKFVLDYYGEGEVHTKDALGNKTDEESYIKLFNKWLEIIEPGDLLVITGHVVLIESVDKELGVVTVIEAVGGDRYDYINHEDMDDFLSTGRSTIERHDLKQNLKNYRKRNLEQLALIRPIQNGNEYILQTGDSYEIKTYDGITSSAQSRLKYSKIDIEKTVKISDGENQKLLVNLGETITYDITIANGSDESYSSFDVIEEIDSNVLLTDLGDSTLDGKRLKWTVPSLNAGESIKISYTVRVPIDKLLFGKIIVSNGKVDNISTSRIETLIGNKFNGDEKNKLLNSFNNLKNNSSVEREFINDIYEDAFDLDLGLTGLTNFDIMSYDSTITTSGKDVLSIKSTKLNDTSVKKYVYHNFYGLRTFGGVSPSLNNGSRDCSDSGLVRIATHWNLYPTYELNDRARVITPDMLLDGDIVLMASGDEVTLPGEVCPILKNWTDMAYIYLDGKLIRKTSANAFEELLIIDEVVEGQGGLAKFLRDLVGHNYVILRPSLAYGNMYDFNIEISSDKYEINTVDNYIYVGNDDKDTIIDNIEVVPADAIINIDLDNSKLQIQYNNVVLKEFKLIYTGYENYELEFDSSLTVDEEKKYIKYLTEGTTVQDLIASVQVVGGTIEIYNVDNNKKNNADALASGDVLTVYLNDEVKDKYTLSVLADANGDGKFNLIDLVQLRMHSVSYVDPETKVVQKKTGVYYYAVDMNKDGTVNLIDLVRMRRKSVGLD